MTVSTSALSIADYAKLSNDPLVQSVVFSLIESGSAMQDIPFINRKSMVVKGSRWDGNLPGVNWAAVNGEPVNTNGVPTPWEEQVFIIRNQIDTDRVLVEDINQITDPRAIRLQAYLKGVAYDFNDKFINNNHTAGDSNAIVGLRQRLDDPTTYGARAANKIDAGGVVVTSAATAAQANSFFEFLDQLLWAVDSPDGNGVILYMNEAMQRRMGFLARLMAGSGGFSTAQDQLGRSVSMYRGATIRDIGYKADQTTRIINVTETNTGLDGSSTYTSIYAVNMGMGHLYGWQYEPIMAQDLGKINNGVTYRTVVDWVCGLANDSSRSIGRLYDVKYS